MKPSSPQTLPEQLFSQSSGRYSAVKKEYDELQRIRGGMDTLLQKGDSVSQEDVLQEISELVAHGSDPKLFAALMAGNPESGLPPMPSASGPLSQWLEQLDSSVLAPYEAQLRPAMALARHQLGTAAVHGVIGEHMRGGGGEEAPGQSPNSGFAPPPAPSPSPLLH